MEMSEVSEIKVVPALRCEEKVFAGCRIVPLIVDGQYSFVAFSNEGLNWYAQFEAIRVIGVIIRTGATSKETEK